ncbi:Endonuclease I [Winogradskyella psychrotolerans RS-3]|uniref:Endonuclease I n=1 Tax=Winogradskyella psychrotolerans RS-3 TaxID=641526 RepID=S7VR39_9FLAO|nr:choice-of-anchor J domain-containing protein [Winogradskyella psychrotolerans]EPR72675.1 Endonuclease I [Winogradskyella psychrotolerans RS-3]
MKKTLLVLFLVPLFSFGQNLFSEDFEVIIDLSAEGWTLYNDGNIPQSGYSPIITDAWSIVDWEAEEGNFAAATTSWFTVPASADRWLVTPGIAIPEGANATLSFKIRSHDVEPWADGYTLKISTGTASKADLSTDLLVVAAAENDLLENVTTTTVDLSSYNGETIFLAWVNTHTDGNLLSLDDILIDGVLSVSDFSKVATAIYPNPTNSEFKIDLVNLNDSNNFDISIIDISGRLLKKYNVQDSYDISDLSTGTYIVKITDGANSYTQQLVKK